MTKRSGLVAARSAPRAPALALASLTFAALAVAAFGRPSPGVGSGVTSKRRLRRYSSRPLAETFGGAVLRDGAFAGETFAGAAFAGAVFAAGAFRGTSVVAERQPLEECQHRAP